MTANLPAGTIPGGSPDIYRLIEISRDLNREGNSKEYDCKKVVELFEALQGPLKRYPEIPKEAIMFKSMEAQRDMIQVTLTNNKQEQRSHKEVLGPIMGVIVNMFTISQRELNKR